MMQIQSVTQARNNFASLIKQVKTTKQPVVIVQDSQPTVIIYSYEEETKRAREEKDRWERELEELYAEGKQIGDQWLTQKGLRKQDLSEDDLYALVAEA